MRWSNTRSFVATHPVSSRPSRAGDAVHVACAGVTAVGGAAMSCGTGVRIASITKPMTAATVLALVDDGTRELAAPVNALLPELAKIVVAGVVDGGSTHDAGGAVARSTRRSRVGAVSVP